MQKWWLGTLCAVGSCLAVACSSSDSDSNPSAGSSQGGSASGGSANAGAHSGGANAGSVNQEEAGAGGAGAAAEAGAGGSDASSGSGSEAGAAGASQAGSSTAGADPGPSSFSLDFPTQSVVEGTQATKCVVLDLGNETSVHIAEIHNQLSAGAFDLIVYKTSAAATSVPTACTPLSSLQPADGVPLMLSHRTDDDLVLPSGVGFTLAPHQKIGLELHYVAAVAGNISSHTTFTVASTPYQAEAGFIMLSNIDVTVPAGLTQVATAYFSGAPLATASIFRFVGYTHGLGTEVTLATSASKLGTQTPIGDLDPTPSATAATGVALFSPPTTVPTGGGFTLSCHYNGAGRNSETTYGTSSTSEQCGALLWYSTAISSSLCFHTSQSGGFDVCCPGGSGCTSI